jgi:hypothetical protein
VTVRELIATLQALDDDLIVLVPGYERHWDVLDVIRVENAILFDGAQEWDGACRSYESAKNIGEPHVLLASKRRLTHASGMGR